MRIYSFYSRQFAKNICQIKCIAMFSTVLVVIFFLCELYITSAIAHAISLFLAGWFTWTFAEYILHRFWMHKPGKAGSYHHHHHTHPTEIKITAFHRFAMILIVMGVGVLALAVNIYFLFFDGFLFGFAAYSCMHWVLHQSWSRKLFPRLHRFHIYHHCKFPDSCYGVTLTWWDVIFGTKPPVGAKLTDRIVAFYYGHDHPKTKTH